MTSPSPSSSSSSSSNSENPPSLPSRLRTYKNWPFTTPTPISPTTSTPLPTHPPTTTPSLLATSGFTWSPIYFRPTSPRLACVSCLARVWILSVHEHPGYWHLPGCPFAVPVAELVSQGWQKARYWEIFGDNVAESMGWEEIDLRWPPGGVLGGEEEEGGEGASEDIASLNNAMEDLSVEKEKEKEKEETQAQPLRDNERQKSTYTYHALSKEKKEIRVLILPKRYLYQEHDIELEDGRVVKRCLRPEQDRMALVGLLRTISLCDIPTETKFQALSYTWGPSSPSYPLHIYDDSMDIDASPAKIQISPNLNSALRHLVVEEDESTLEKEPMLYIWIDALCINQHNPTEKAWQVEIMYQIYQRAERVIVWLGPGTSSSNLAMEVLQGMRRVSQTLKPYRETAHADGFGESVVDMRRIPPEAVDGLHKDDLELAAAFGLLFKQEISGSEWIRPFPIDEVAALFERPYWSRIWILQEYAAAQEIVVVCGMKRIGEECFRTFMSTWDGQMSEKVIPPRGIDHRPWAVVGTRRDMGIGRAILEELADPEVDEVEKSQMRAFLEVRENRVYVRNLKMLLQEAWKAQLEASNPLDHIYALLNLAADRDELGIRVDYTVSPVELYTRTTKAIYATGDLALMAYCNGGNSGLLPSWVPNFLGERGWISLREHCGHAWYGTSAFDASQGKQPVIAFDDANPRVMEISGILVDEVSFVDVGRVPVGVNEVTNAHRRHMAHWLRQGFDYLKDVECEAYSSAEKRKEAVWKTPILDHFRLGEGTVRAGAEAERGYDVLLSEDDAETQDPEATRLADIYFSQMMGASNGTRPFRTGKGYIGLGAAKAEVGDLVVVFLGSEVPFVVRKVDDGRYRLVGEAYVHGIMFSELFDGKPRIDTFHLC